MSNEESPLPDFSGEDNFVKPAGLPVRPSVGRGLPRNPSKSSESAFAMIEADEVSKTLDFGMSEEDMLDDSAGEGSSSDLHDSLRALHGQPGAVEEDFSALSADYESGIREEDTYSKPVADFELPELDAVEEKSGITALPVNPFASRKASTGPVPVHDARKPIELPDFSKFDEPEKVEEVSENHKSTPLEEIKEPEKKFSMKMLVILAVIVVAVAAAVVIFSTVLAPSVVSLPTEHFTNLLR